MLDSFWKVTVDNICFTCIGTVDDFGKGVVVVVFVTSHQREDSIRKGWELFEKKLEAMKIRIKLKNVTIDNCDASANVLESKGIPHIICRFHVLKNWMDKLKNYDTHTRIQVTRWCYQVLSCTSLENYDTLVNELESIDPSFYQYYMANYDSIKLKITNINRTSSYSFFNTNNYIEANIKKVQREIFGERNSKHSLDVCVIRILQFLQKQTPNKVPIITVVEKECNARLISARQMLNTSLETLIHEGVYIVSSFRPECKTIYSVAVGKDGFFCTCDDFVYKMGQPCKHILYILLKQNLLAKFSSLYEADCLTFVQEACIHFGINVQDNCKSTIPHFIPNKVLHIATDEATFPTKEKCGRKRNVNVLTDEQEPTDHIAYNNNLGISLVFVTNGKLIFSCKKDGRLLTKEVATADEHLSVKTFAKHCKGLMEKILANYTNTPRRKVDKTSIVTGFSATEIDLYVKLTDKTLRFVRHHKNGLTKLLDRILNNEFMAQCFHHEEIRHFTGILSANAFSPFPAFGSSSYLYPILPSGCSSRVCSNPVFPAFPGSSAAFIGGSLSLPTFTIGSSSSVNPVAAFANGCNPGNTASATTIVSAAFSPNTSIRNLSPVVCNSPLFDIAKKFSFGAVGKLSSQQLEYICEDMGIPFKNKPQALKQLHEKAEEFPKYNPGDISDGVAATILSQKIKDYIYLRNEDKLV